MSEHAKKAANLLGFSRKEARFLFISVIYINREIISPEEYAIKVLQKLLLNQNKSILEIIIEPELFPALPYEIQALVEEARLTGCSMENLPFESL